MDWMWNESDETRDIGHGHWWKLWVILESANAISYYRVCFVCVCHTVLQLVRCRLHRHPPPPPPPRDAATTSLSASDVAGREPWSVSSASGRCPIRPAIHAVACMPSVMSVHAAVVKFASWHSWWRCVYHSDGIGSVDGDCCSVISCRAARYASTIANWSPGRSTSTMYARSVAARPLHTRRLSVHECATIGRMHACMLGGVRVRDRLRPTVMEHEDM